MTQEEKSLLLKDLCARLPYDVCANIRYKDGEPCYGKLTPRDIQWFIDSNIEVIKPYLRPMSSMTTKEEYEYHQIRKRNNDKLLAIMDCNDHLQQLLFPIIIGTESIDWLNAHHFDYRGLIERGLALEAPKGMYNLK